MSLFFNESYSENEKKEVWSKASQYKDGWAKDTYGAWMLWSAYGDRANPYGWEIDHIRADSKGGSDNTSNLQPLQWKNNADKSDTKVTSFSGSITSGLDVKGNACNMYIATKREFSC